MEELKVLSIGNSFSVDGMQYLYDIANDYGIRRIVLGNLYIGGCSIEMHVNQINNNLTDYIYYKNTKGLWEETYNTSILKGLLDEEWDIISLQQVSHYSGLDEKYNNQINELIEFVNKNRTNKSGILVWHMTWAYQNQAEHGGFAFYDYNQTKMYKAITSCVEKNILTNKAINKVIPTGTMIQNMRNSFLGDTLTRDGFHLSLEKGRFFASMCWFKTLTDLPLDKLLYKPQGVTEEELKLAKTACDNAYKKPYDITYF